MMLAWWRTSEGGLLCIITHTHTHTLTHMQPLKCNQIHCNVLILACIPTLDVWCVCAVCMQYLCVCVCLRGFQEGMSGGMEKCLFSEQVLPPLVSQCH